MNNENCEWDKINNIFQKAIKEQNLSEKQVNDIMDKIKIDIQNKKKIKKYFDEHYEETEEEKQIFKAWKERRLNNEK